MNLMEIYRIGRDYQDLEHRERRAPTIGTSDNFIWGGWRKDEELAKETKQSTGGEERNCVVQEANLKIN